MPIHDWSRVPSGLFHDFHQSWSIRIKDALNSGRLPKGVAALVEQRAGPKESDVLAIEARPRRHLDEKLDGGIATLPPPVTRIVRRTTNEIYASRANRIVVKHHLGRIIAVIEIVSPGNKDSRAALRDFVEKTVDCLLKGIHVLIVDLFSPTQRDPYGIHKVIWDEIVEEEFMFPDGNDCSTTTAVRFGHTGPGSLSVHEPDRQPGAAVSRVKRAGGSTRSRSSALALGSQSRPMSALKASRVVTAAPTTYNEVNWLMTGGDDSCPRQRQPHGSPSTNSRTPICTTTTGSS
jgi:hypothetical protein